MISWEQGWNIRYAIGHLRITVGSVLEVGGVCPEFPKVASLTTAMIRHIFDSALFVFGGSWILEGQVGSRLNADI